MEIVEAHPEPRVVEAEVMEPPRPAPMGRRIVGRLIAAVVLGVVGGWLTHERGSGVVFTRIDGGTPAMEARLEYGRLRLEPGHVRPDARGVDYEQIHVHR